MDSRSPVANSANNDTHTKTSDASQDTSNDKLGADSHNSGTLAGQDKLFKRKPLLVCVAVVSVGLIGLVALALIRSQQFLTISLPDISDNYHAEEYNGETYLIYDKAYTGEFDLQFGDLPSEYYENNNSSDFFDTKQVMSFREYAEYCRKWSLRQNYHDDTKKYIVIAQASLGAARVDSVKFAGITVDASVANVYIYDKFVGGVANVPYYVLTIPVNKEVKTLNVNSLITAGDLQVMKNEQSSESDEGKTPKLRKMPMSLVGKPIIYLYPISPTEVSVTLGYPDRLTTVYPTYQNGWRVMAQPDGTLQDRSTGRELYSLYYESITAIDFSRTNEGFVVRGEDSAFFLEQKLSLLGLTPREAEEFIIYWLPKLESSPYNYIRFATIDEIDQNMPLSISPTPDSIIRILMIYEPLDSPIVVTGQHLTTPTRTGFTAVEWGGTEIK